VLRCHSDDRCDSDASDDRHSEQGESGWPRKPEFPRTERQQHATSAPACRHRKATHTRAERECPAARGRRLRGEPRASREGSLVRSRVRRLSHLRRALRAEPLEVRGGFRVTPRARDCDAFYLALLPELLEEDVCVLLGVRLVVRTWCGRYEVAAREGPDFVLLGEYGASDASALLFAGVVWVAKMKYVRVGLVAIVHCPLQLDVYARIAP
jgi:hypothetical protein